VDGALSAVSRRAPPITVRRMMVVTDSSYALVIATKRGAL
jgi:hypothetical protein